MDNLLSIFAAVAASFFIAILSGLGVGSGGLFVIWLVAAYGISAPQARGMNLLFFVFSATAALVLHYLRKRVDIALILKLSVFALIGTVFGTVAARYISASLLKKIFGGFLVFAGAYSLFSKAPSKSRQVKRDHSPQKALKGENKQ